MLSLANCSCLIAGADWAMSCSKQMPGTRKEVPYRTSATEVAVSVLGAFLNPSKTQGRVLVHDPDDVAAHLRAFFSDL